MHIYSNVSFLELFCISLERLDRNCFKPRHIIFTMSENFALKIGSLQHLEIFKKNLACEPAKNPRYNIHCFDVMLIFPCRLFSGICIECDERTFHSTYVPVTSQPLRVVIPLTKLISRLPTINMNKANQSETM